MSILLFLGVLFVLILVHEWGHFITAKKTGMQVDEFGIGFPPKLFGFKKGETEYTLNALPIGGFVKILGENGDEPFSPAQSEAGNHLSGTNVETVDGRANSGTQRNPRSFGSRPKWAQALVLIAGVTMNIMFAWLLFSVTYIIGVPTAVDEADAGPEAELVIAGAVSGSPAEVLPPGAVVTGLSSSLEGGSSFTGNLTPTALADFVTANAPNEIVVTYESGGEISEVLLTPVQGLIQDEPERYAIGASLALVETRSMPFFTALVTGVKATWGGLQAITVGLWTLIVQSFTGTADFTQVAGPIGIVGMVGDAAAFGLTALLTFTAIISLNLAVINLLPFPALDGGRLVFVAIEAVTGKDIPPEWAGRINLVGFGLLLLLMVLVTYNDIINLL